MQKIVSIYCIWFALLQALPIYAGPSCDGIEAFIKGVDQEIDPNKATELASNIIPNAESCVKAQVLGQGVTVNCRWGFDYRSAGLEESFEHLSDTIANCFKITAQKSDHPVSHPDYYKLRQYEASGRMISVSIKDKGALEHSFIFVSVSQMN